MSITERGGSLRKIFEILRTFTYSPGILAKALAGSKGKCALCLEQFHLKCSNTMSFFQKESFKEVMWGILSYCGSKMRKWPKKKN